MGKRESVWKSRSRLWDWKKDCPGNREQLRNNRDGILCLLDPEKIADRITVLLKDRTKRAAFKREAETKEMPWGEELELLIEFMERG